jgi:hypothetical protein
MQLLLVLLHVAGGNRPTYPPTRVIAERMGKGSQDLTSSE